jgi:hypothetical protein
MVEDVLDDIDTAMASGATAEQMVILGLNLAEARAWAGQGQPGEIVAAHLATEEKQRKAGRRSFATFKERMEAARAWRRRLTYEKPLADLARTGLIGKACAVLAAEPVVLDASADPPRVGKVNAKTVQRTLEWEQRLRSNFTMKCTRNDKTR